MFEFADPILFLMLPLPLVAYFLFPGIVEQRAAMVVPDSVGKQILEQSGTGRGSLVGNIMIATMVWVLLVIALAGPRQLIATPALPTSGRDMVLAIDLSGSMVQKDFFIDGKIVSRLDAVKKVASEFVRRRGGDRLGLIVFGSEAYFATPLSYDVEAVAQTIEQLVIGISGRATNISNGLGLALKRFTDSNTKSRVVILLSDGASNAGAATPRGVAKLAKNMGVRVHTIALGPKELTGAANERGVVDVATLKDMSSLSGGEMFRVRTTQDLVSVTRSLDQLEASESAGLAAEIYKDLWLYPAILAALGCLVYVGRETG